MKYAKCLFAVVVVVASVVFTGCQQQESPAAPETPSTNAPAAEAE